MSIQESTIDEKELILFANSAYGVYIPQFFAESIDRGMVTGISEEEYSILLEGPEHEEYWDAWESVLDNARITIDGSIYYLYQDMDLWIATEKGVEYLFQS
jgi:hypothetical protein